MGTVSKPFMPLTRTHLQPGAEEACRPLSLTVQETPCVDVAPLRDLGNVPLKPSGGFPASCH